MIQIQIKPCPKCGKRVGWWVSFNRNSMAFYAVDGEKIEHRLYEGKRKHCAECNADITTCVK